jgi:hypothetical protein
MKHCFAKKGCETKDVYILYCELLFSFFMTEWTNIIEKTRENAQIFKKHFSQWNAA